MASFPFNKLSMELQLLVWQHARADVGQVIIGNVDYNYTGELTLRGCSRDRAKDYLRLLSICHISRQEALRRPLVFLVKSGKLPFITCIDYEEVDITQSLAIRQWHFGHVFSDIIIEISEHTNIWTSGPELEWDSESLSIARHRHVHRGRLAKALARFFGPNIRRVHLYGCDEWERQRRREGRLLWATNEPVNATFHDADALHFLTPSWGDNIGSELVELREVVRQDVHGEASHSTSIALAVIGDHDPGMFVSRENFIHTVTRMKFHFPNLEYVSLLSFATHESPTTCASATEVGAGDTSGEED